MAKNLLNNDINEILTLMMIYHDGDCSDVRHRRGRRLCPMQQHACHRQCANYSLGLSAGNSLEKNEVTITECTG